MNYFKICTKLQCIYVSIFLITCFGIFLLFKYCNTFKSKILQFFSFSSNNKNLVEENIEIYNKEKNNDNKKEINDFIENVEKANSKKLKIDNNSGNKEILINEFSENKNQINNFDEFCKIAEKEISKEDFFCNIEERGSKFYNFIIQKEFFKSADLKENFKNRFKFFLQNFYDDAKEKNNLADFQTNFLTIVNNELFKVVCDDIILERIKFEIENFWEYIHLRDFISYAPYEFDQEHQPKGLKEEYEYLRKEHREIKEQLDKNNVDFYFTKLKKNYKNFKVFFNFTDLIFETDDKIRIKLLLKFKNTFFDLMNRISILNNQLKEFIKKM